MKHTCPKCGNTHDVGIKEVLNWIEKSEKLRKAVGSLIGRINGRKAPSRPLDPEAARKMSSKRWAGHVRKNPPRKKKVDPSDLDL